MPGPHEQQKPFEYAAIDVIFGIICSPFASVSIIGCGVVVAVALKKYHNLN